MHFPFTSREDTIPRRHGSILLLVLVAVIIMTLTTSSYLLLMRNEHLAARYSGGHLQTEMLTRSGIAYLQVLLGQTTAEIEQQGGLVDNPSLLQDVLVIDDELANYRGRFTIVAPSMGQGYDQYLRYGLENESAKLNLNSLVVRDESSATDAKSGSPRDRLLVIPGMNEAVADAILDWLDEDDSPRTNGAESSYYQSLSPAYQPRNGPLAHLDELLMIQGVTPELLYGMDVDRNFLIDAEEFPRGALEQLDNSNGQLNRGWSAYLTVHSSERNSTPSGDPKIDVNGENIQALHNDLQEALGAAEANFIVAFRQFGPMGNSGSGQTAIGASVGSTSGSNSGSSSGGNSSGEGEAVSAESVEIDFTKEAQTPISSLLDLVGARVSIEGKENEPAKVVESPWQDDPAAYRLGFTDLLDAATADPGERVAGRININLASRPVLLAIPGMTDVLADQILTSRDPASNPIDGEQRYPIWLIADGLTTLDELKSMMPFLTTGGDVYSGQVVGFFDGGTNRARTRVVLDRSETPTRLIEWQDLDRLGPGFSRTALSSIVLPGE